jgi:Bacterial SH3 domain
MLKKMVGRVSIVVILVAILSVGVLITAKPAHAASNVNDNAFAHVKSNLSTAGLSIGTVQNASAANVRSGPGTNYSIITTQPRYANVIYTGSSSNGWYQVFYSFNATSRTATHYDTNHVGWIAGSLLVPDTQGFHCLLSGGCTLYYASEKSPDSNLYLPPPDCSYCDVFTGYKYLTPRTGAGSGVDDTVNLNYWYIETVSELGNVYDYYAWNYDVQAF